MEVLRMVWDIWDPEEYRREMNKFLESFRMPIMKGFKEPLVDIEVTDKDVIARIELPGIDKNDIDLNITEDAVQVKAEKKKEAEIKKKGFYRQERSYTGFQRAFSLPVKVKPEDASAKLEKGVLEIVMPKAKPEKAEKKGKKIAVK
jgi:HSP20 family protein